MGKTFVFADILDSVEALSLDEQEALMEIVRRRADERRRKGLTRDVEEARREFRDGACKPASPGEILEEILS